MSQYNKLSDIQYARFHILTVDLHFETVLVSWYPHHVHTSTFQLLFFVQIMIACNIA